MLLYNTRPRVCPLHEIIVVCFYIHGRKQQLGTRTVACLLLVVHTAVSYQVGGNRINRIYKDGGKATSPSNGTDTVPELLLPRRRTYRNTGGRNGINSINNGGRKAITHSHGTVTVPESRLTPKHTRWRREGDDRFTRNRHSTRTVMRVYARMLCVCTSKAMYSSIRS